MATNVPSQIRRATRNGRHYGVRITERDRDRLAALSRWYALTTGHIVRHEYDPQIWSPNSPTYGTESGTEAVRKANHAVWHRLNQLRRIQNDVGRNLGPLTGAEMNPDGVTAWYATNLGAVTASAPWRLRNSINPLFAAHAWMAADIGMAVESKGYRVLSERELSTGIDKNGDRITAKLESQYVTSKEQTIGKKPDVAILHPNGRDYIAVEVERDRSRNVRIYDQKLRAYKANSSVLAVWYICAHPTTANRVADGAVKALGQSSQFPLRIVVNEPTHGFHFLDMEHLPRALQSDLEPMTDDTTGGDWA